ncbi:MAG: TonB-dependent receptor [Acidobacteriota bacterium]|mgnify:CR=1 FL=1
MTSRSRNFPARLLLGGVVLAALWTPPQAYGQVLYGSLVGNVKDASDAPVPGAEVTITHKVTNQSRRALTSDAGSYVFPTLSSGLYDVSVRKEGFALFSRKDVGVTINTVSRVDVTLQLGAITQSVEVTEQPAALQTDRAEVRAEMTSRELQNLPIPPGRNYQQLFKILPGFTPPANRHSSSVNPSRALGFNVNGTSNQSNNVRIDGASAINIWLPRVAAYVPALESIETVNVVTNAFDAEQGLAGGAVINVQTKSGTNELHGALFEYHDDNQLKAKPFFNPPGERNPKAVFNQFGATLGGPIVRNRLFYFASYEGMLERRTGATFATVPTAGIRSGDMSASPRPVYDPLTGNPDGSGRTALPGNIVPRSRIDPIVQKLVALTPPPTFSDSLTSNYYATAPFGFDRHSVDAKVNWHASSKFTMYGRFGTFRHEIRDEQVFGALGGPGIRSADTQAFGYTNTATVAGTYVVQPNLIVDSYFGWTLLDTTGEFARLDEKLGLDFLGIPGTNGSRRFEGGWPRFSISSYTGLGAPSANRPLYYHNPQYQYVANANWTKGSHNIRFGLDFYLQQLNQTQPEVGGASHGASGGFTFSGGPTTVRGGPSANQFNSYANFLLGLPTTTGKILQVTVPFTNRTRLYSYYVRDQWQVSRKLTLSYGLRWEYLPIPTRADRGVERYDPSTNRMLICGVGSVPRNCGVEISKRSFAPRLGIAYRATDTFVVRAGYGITNDPYSLANPMRANYPTAIGLTIPGPNAFQPAGLLRDGIPSVKPPDLGDGRIAIPGDVVATTLPDRFNRGYIQSWNFTLQRQLKWGFTGQAGYVATRQVRQLGVINLNVGRPGGGTRGLPLNQRFGRTASTDLVTPLGTGHYNALQTTLERRFANGYQLYAMYTWSKAMGICCNDDSEGGPGIPLPEYYRLNRSVTGYDRPHNLQIAGIAELPFGSRKRWLNGGGLASALAGGWQVNAVFSAYSGLPFSVSASGASLDAPGSRQRADQVKTTVNKLGGVGRGQSFFDPLAFAPVTEARFGTAGFNSLRGPGAVNLDVGLFREFRVQERWRIQFRAESFNFTNTPHFNNPGGNVSNLQLNQDGSIRSLGGYTEITGTSGTGREGIDERVFRFGVRISF